MKLSQLATRATLSLLLSSISGAYATTSVARATTCNGSPDLCNKSFGNVTFVGTHNSYAVGTGSLFVNQDWDITQQLTDGVRMLQSQAHNSSGTIHLCHSSCSLLDGGSLQDYLTTLKTWMDSNTQEVVSLLIVNIDNLPASTYADVFTSVGLDTMAYSPPSAALTASEWPTLGELIDSGKRLVVFLTGTTDFTTVPWIIDEFTNIWETAYDVTDTTFNCEVNRTRGDTATQMYLINHFLDKLVAGVPAPDSARANTTNAVSGTGSLGLQVETCANQHGRNPNFMLVDFYEYGNGSVFQVAADANGVAYNPTTAIAQPRTSGSSGSNPSSSSPTVVSSGNGAVESRALPTQVLAATAVLAGLFAGALAFF